MAAINDLINQIEDKELRTRIEQELNKLTKQKKFGIVYEEHLPECVPLYDMPIKRGCKVALKTGKVNEFYTVMQVEGDNVYCTDKKENQLINFLKKDLVCVSEFGEPIYPYLKQIDSIYNSDDTELPTHALIQADNYHALQLLEYLYAGKVDCIYIDPPYNTGAKDWKYNNDYVDSNDTYRHSKWLSMMKKRLLLAKKLLNPADSVMIVTIDEKEYLHLGCLLEELFPEAKIQMVSSIINPKGRATNYFTRTDEYLFYVFFGNATICATEKNSDKQEVRWPYLKRSDTDSTRGHRPRQFYPIYVNTKSDKIEKVGNPIALDVDRFSVEQIKDCIAVFPVNEDGTEMEWGLTKQTLELLINQGFVRVGKRRKNNPMEYSFSYLSTADAQRLLDGELEIIGEREDGTKIVVNETGKFNRATTIWTFNTHDAGAYGKTLIGDCLNSNRFSYPKSLYAVHDAIRFFVANKPTALIVDFFAGSGTTLHAVNLLNAEDGGKRQCIMITNNEVSDDEAKSLTTKGFSPGNKEWEELGIAQYVNWPRTKCSILGNDIKDNPIDGEYLTHCKQPIEIDRKIIQIAMDGDSLSPEAKKSILSLQGKIPQNILTQNSNYVLDEKYTISILFNMTSANEWLEALQEQSQIDEIYIVTDKKNIFNQLKNKIKETLGKVTKDENIKLPMADGFKANAVFFKLGFLDKTSVQLGRQFKELVPLLWLKAGGWGKCPDIEDLVKDTVLPPYIILPENRFAVLIDEKFFAEFESKVNEQNDILTVYIVTDFEKGFKSMTSELKAEKTYQLYRDYLDNFRINIER